MSDNLLLTEIENNIINCIIDKGKIQKQKLIEILCGKSEYISSPFWGIYKDSSITELSTKIDTLICNNILIINDLFETLTVDINKLAEYEAEKPISTDNIKDANILKAINLINEHENLFITGHAGTGKSFILENLKKIIPKLVITSTTGLAAVNVKGQTIHSWAGVGICNKPISNVVDDILSNYTLKTQIQTCKILAIDEISMLDINTFEYINEVLKQVRDNEKPFGGIELVVIGDYLQLPPIDNNFTNEKKYCFESELWKNFNFQTILLTKNYRQNEENLINVLSHIRTNNLTKEDINLLKTREFEDNEEFADTLHLFATNEEANRYNLKRFDLINMPQYDFEAIDITYQDTNVLNYSRADKLISLKLGARVMLLINLNFEKGLINGSCGTILEIGYDYILIKFDNGVDEKIQRHEFEFYKNDKLIASRKQFPLCLAYGITIHKSQGMTLDKLFVDCTRIFEKGQIYVALSRIKTLNGLFLKNFNPNKVKVDNRVIEFYKQIIGNM